MQYVGKSPNNLVIIQALLCTTQDSTRTAIDNIIAVIQEMFFIAVVTMAMIHNMENMYQDVSTTSEEPPAVLVVWSSYYSTCLAGRVLFVI